MRLPLVFVPGYAYFDRAWGFVLQRLAEHFESGS